MSLPPGYVEREVVREDFQAITELTNRIEQEKLTPEDHIQRWENKNRKQWRRVVTFGDEIIAYGSALQALTGHGDIFLLRVDVDDAHQKKGIGRHLLAEAEQAARDMEARVISTKARDDMAREMRFLEAAEYEAFENMRGVTLDLTTFEMPSNPPQADITHFGVIGDTPESRARLYEVYRESDKETPGVEVWGIPDFENWQAGTFTGSWYRPEGLLVALDNDEWVGMAIIGPMENDMWTTDYTGVLPSHRGRGIGTALKLKGIELAMSHGGKEIHTFNDELNAPMRAINAKLGFKPETGWWMYKKDGAPRV